MSQRCVLVVDDDRLVRESLSEALGEMGCETQTAPGGVTALELLAAAPRDLVVSDVDMPDISGFELLNRMQHRHITTPMVLMSARADAALDRAAHEAGAVALLPKPVALGPFTILVHRLLGF